MTYIYIQKLINSNKIDFYYYLVQLKQKLQIENIICIDEGNPSKFEQFEFILIYIWQGSHQNSEKTFPDFPECFPSHGHKIPWPFSAFYKKFDQRNEMLITTPLDENHNVFFNSR